ncbi:TonB family protein [Corallococcus exiguus]|uniref:energy transducer TonB n=1 Tax=Corallococcus TaxID=83461 RepID=UPI000EA3D5CD|nr:MULTISPECIES: energy transducer TonB [Corallococcus]NNC15435.1 TonB family protein [Corallococcus exiguus]NRD62782.1 TonB family protein [Corallococcus exiguus]RKH22219.1 energy transducer TonB [Corallococcus sp. CA041A]
MFESVIERRGVRSGRFGTGAWVSIGVHAGLLGLVFFISGRVPETVEQPLKDVVFRQPTIQLGTMNAAQPKPVTTAPKPKPKPRTDRIPLNPKPLPADPPEVKPDPEPTTIADAADTTDPTGTGETGQPGHPDGDRNSTSPIGAVGVPGIPTAPTGTEVLPFTGGMTPPKMLSGSQFSYTLEARRAGVEGMIIAKCVITTEGRVRDCRIIKGLPFMDDAVLESLSSRTYQPLTFQGRPVNVSYTFNIRLKMP